MDLFLNLILFYIVVNVVYYNLLVYTILKEKYTYPGPGVNLFLWSISSFSYLSIPLPNGCNLFEYVSTYGFINCSVYDVGLGVLSESNGSFGNFFGLGVNDILYVGDDGRIL